MHGKRHLSEAELVACKKRRAAGEASLACEGLYLNDEQKARFNRFERERLTHDECLKEIIEFYRSVAQSSQVIA